VCRLPCFLRFVTLQQTAPGVCLLCFAEQPVNGYGSFAPGGTPDQGVVNCRVETSLRPALLGCATQGSTHETYSQHSKRPVQHNGWKSKLMCFCPMPKNRCGLVYVDRLIDEPRSCMLKSNCGNDIKD
jgi:hypothetical protein